MEGELRIGTETFGKYDYVYLPKGFPRHAASSTGGAVALCFYYGVPEARKGAAPDGTYDASRLTPRANLFEDGWDADYSGINAPEMVISGARKKNSPHRSTVGRPDLAHRVLTTAPRTQDRNPPSGSRDVFA